MHGPEPFITVLYASCVSSVKDWSTDTVHENLCGINGKTA